MLFRPQRVGAPCRSGISTACIAGTWRLCGDCWSGPRRWAGRRSCSRSIRIRCGCCGRSNRPPPLTWTERKAELLAAQGVDWIVAYPTDEALLQLSAVEFFEQIVRGKLAAKALVEGPNFFFGHNREGTVERLAQLASEPDISLDVVSAGGRSTVRSFPARACGNWFASAKWSRRSELLSAPYRIRGMVTHGAGRGAKIGFPTANLSAIDTLLPALGVYAGRAWVGDASYPAAINLGAEPDVRRCDDSRRSASHWLQRSALRPAVGG